MVCLFIYFNSRGDFALNSRGGCWQLSGDVWVEMAALKSKDETINILIIDVVIDHRNHNHKNVVASSKEEEDIFIKQLEKGEAIREVECLVKVE